MWKLIFISLVGLAIAEKIKYDNYKVFRIAPQTKEQFEIVRNLEDVSDAVCKIFILHNISILIFYYI